MGRMQDALRKAAEERERRRRLAGGSSEATASPEAEVPAASRDRAEEALRIEPQERPARISESLTPAEVRPVETPKPRKSATAETLTAPPSDSTRKARFPAARTSETHLPATTTERRFDVDQRVITFHKPNDPRAEQFRTIRTALLGLEPLPRTIMITSGSPKEGKSVATANLAASLVEGGRRRVLVVDANFRNPKQTEILAARSRGGLSDVLAGTIQDPRTVVVGTAIPGVDLLPAGSDTTNPGALILPKAVAEVLAILEPSYDFIFVDVPSLEEFADASVVAGDVDGVLLVLQIQGPPRRAAEKAVEVLQSARARVLGVIATNSKD